jgi:biotin carboxyl carrier protein
VVDYAPFETVHTPGPGFVRDICVSPGEFVEKGQVLVLLQHEETDCELADVRIAIQQSLVRGRVLHRDEETAQYQFEAEIRQALQKQELQLQQQVEKLTVRAPIAGRVIGPELDAMEGQYFETGSPLLALGSEYGKEIQLSIPEHGLKEFTRQLGTAPVVRVNGYQAAIRSGRLSKIDPRGSVALIHPALAASAGGTLAIRRRLEPDRTSKDNAAPIELLAPRFTGIIELPREHARQLYAGQLATVRLAQSNRTVGAYLYRILIRWLRSKTDVHSAGRAGNSIRL